MKRRPGVSLLEIMISIGVVGIGLIGVASLIPLAHYKAAEGVREDRKALYGKRAFREFFIQGFDDPGSMAFMSARGNLSPRPHWLHWPSPVNNVYWIYEVPGSAQLIPQTYCFDPHWVAAATERNIPGAGAFPIQGPPEVTVPRITVLKMRPDDLQESILRAGNDTPQARNEAMQKSRLLVFTTGTHMSLATAEEIFRLRDDIEVQDVALNSPDAYYPMIPMPGAPDESAQRAYLREPLIGSDQTPYPTKAISGGSFSWMATLMPELFITYNSGPQVPYTSNRYLMSIVVFHQRDLTGAFREEVVARVNLNRSIMQGATKQIYVVENPTPPFNKDNVGVRHIRHGDWIALAQNPAPSAPPQPNFTRLRWYQVIAADEADPDNEATNTFDLERELTLSGPDWTIDPTVPLYAIYLRNVEAVYEKSVELK